jgi:uncharacterized protein HemX
MATPPAEPSPSETKSSQIPPAVTTTEKTKPASVTKPPKAHGSGVMAAIIATVLIVLVLAALAVYAYLQQH